MVPVPGITCIGMEYFCFKGDGLWSSADADLGELAASELGQLGLARKPRRDRRQGRARAQGLSDLRQRLPRAPRSSFARTWIQVARTCTPSVGTACTSTTTRIIRCSRR